MLSMLLLCPLKMRNFQFPLLKLLKDPMIFDRVMPHKLMKKMKFFVLTYEQLCMAFVNNNNKCMQLLWCHLKVRMELNTFALL